MESLAEFLEDLLGHPIEILSSEPVGGGCIHDSRRLKTSGDTFFLKQSSWEDRALLETEAAGLTALARTKTVRTPTLVGRGKVGQQFVLLLEWMDLGPLENRSGAILGEQLAALHRAGGSETFGWEQDNFIGATPQQNAPNTSWPEFFRERRLLPQISLAQEQGHSLPDAEPLLSGIESFFPDGAEPTPSPLHGDLWGGNAASDGAGNPVLFDPAFYFGDPETDLAFSHFFGGFPASFYRSYQEQISERPGWKTRQTLYNLYHVLNHLNLFGSSYQTGAVRMIEELNAAAKGAS